MCWQLPCPCRTIVSPSQEGEGKETELDYISYDTPYHYSFAQLKEVLKMGVGILVRLAAEWASLHHVDETRFELKVHIPDINVGFGSHVGSMEGLYGHGGCWCLNDGFFYRENDMRRNDVTSDLPHEFLWIFNKVCRQGETGHTLPLFSSSRRKQKQY
jgi:hypothetical protein